MNVLQLYVLCIMSVLTGDRYERLYPTVCIMYLIDFLIIYCKFSSVI